MTCPRVLIVYHSCINKADSNTVSLGNWFAEWPKDSLAQIYSGNEVGDHRFCGHTFCLGLDERRFGRLFFWLKRSSLGETGQSHSLSKDQALIGDRMGDVARLKNAVASKMLGSGLWELMFPPVISLGMAKWIEDFKPDVIYVQGYHLSIVWLAISLQDRFALPICYHAVDDWPRFLYANSFVSRYIRPFVESAAQKLIESSSVRFSIGDRMANEYNSRYGLEIESLMICDSLERFRTAKPCRLVQDDCISILYSGGLGHYRWKSLVDLSVAARVLENQGTKVKIHVFTSSVPPEASEALRDLSNVHFEPLPSHKELPGILKGADILFLPESFDPVEADVIRLSVSTKAPLYMMSGNPILVYGSSETGVVDYAKQSEWGYVVEKQDVELLAAAIRRLQEDIVLRQKIVTKALEVAERNHEASNVRKRLLAGLLRAVGAHSPMH